MIRILLTITFIVVTIAATAQGMRKYPIGNSGCSLSMYCDPGKFDFDYSQDSSGVYTAECVKEDVHYGVICIKLLVPITELDKAEEMMISYHDFLRADFHAKGAPAYGKGHRLNNNEHTRGMIDYFDDTDGNKWKMKSWTDGRFIGVLYGYTQKELPETKVNLFLDSFRLPAQ